MTRGPLLVASVLALGSAAAVGYWLLRSEEDGGYAGLTAQRLPIRLAPSGDGKRFSLDVSWIDRCGDPEIVRTARRRAVRIRADGQFSWTGRHVIPGGDGDEERHRLSLHGRRNDDGTLSGTWSAQRSFLNGQAAAFGGPGAGVSKCPSVNAAYRMRTGGSTRPPAPRTNRAGKLVIALDHVPDAIAVGAGRAWVTGKTSKDRGRIVADFDPQTGRAGRHAARDSHERRDGDFAAGEGASWLADDFPFRLTRVDARTRRVTVTPRKPSSGVGSPFVEKMAVGHGGVWLLDGDRVLRADPRSGQIVRKIALAPDPRAPTARRCPGSDNNGKLVAIGAGAVWVTSTTLSRCPHRTGQRLYLLSRIDPRTNRVTRVLRLRRAYTALAAGRDGVWGATYLRPALHRISLRDGRPATVTPLPSTDRSRGSANGLAVSPGAVWVSQSVDDQRGALRRLDLATGSLVTVLELAGRPTNVAVGEGGAWVADRSARTLIRVPVARRPP